MLSSANAVVLRSRLPNLRYVCGPSMGLRQALRVRAVEGGGTPTVTATVGLAESAASRPPPAPGMATTVPTRAIIRAGSALHSAPPVVDLRRRYAVQNGLFASASASA